MTTQTQGIARNITEPLPYIRGGISYPGPYWMSNPKKPRKDRNDSTEFKFCKLIVPSCYYNGIIITYELFQEEQRRDQEKTASAIKNIFEKAMISKNIFYQSEKEKRYFRSDAVKSIEAIDMREETIEIKVRGVSRTIRLSEIGPEDMRVLQGYGKQLEIQTPCSYLHECMWLVETTENPIGNLYIIIPLKNYKESIIN